jgi:crossover junction endodeoxyribonuclease RusA
VNRLILPYPVSANRYWRHFRGMTVKSADARKYQAECQAIALSAGYSEPLQGPIHVEMSYHPKKPKKATGKPVRSLDCSNVCKVAEDALNGIAWVDDKQITHLSIAKCEPIEGGALIVSWRAA